MSERTAFAGLEVLAPGEPLSSDGFRFTAVNPAIIARLLQVGAITHKHDAHAAVADPSEAPLLSTAPEGGTIPAATTLHAAFTWVDEDGGETAPSPIAAITTAAGLEAPTGAPTLAIDNAAGNLLAANYDYAITVTDGAGGETTVGPAESVVVEPGHEFAQVHISGLKALREAVGGTDWRLWRRTNGGVWYLIAEGAGDEVLDNGTLAGDCTVQPPTNTTAHGTNTVTVEVGEAAPPRAASFNLYVSEDGALASPSFLANHPLADIGKPLVLAALEPTNGEPPLVSLSLPGASKIDPDTDMIAWPWRRPVANAAALPTEGNENGDVRETLNDHALHSWDAESKTWVEISGGGGGSGGHQILDPAGAGMPAEPKLQFIGTPVSVTDDAEHNRTIVTIAAGAPIKYEGAWKVGTTYAVDDVVTRGGGSYLAIAETTGNDPTTDEGVHWGILAAPGAEGGGGGGAINWRGAWSNVATYAKDDAVSFAGGSYVSLVEGENKGNKPDTHPEDWGILALPGSGLVPSGPWLVGTTYTTGDLVRRNGSAYVSKKEGNVGNDPALDAEELNWMLLVEKGGPGEPGAPGSGMSWKGAWASGTTYKIGDGVLRGGSGYISVAEANKGHDPSTDGGVHWQLFAERGGEGPAGPKGSAGLRYRGEYSGATTYQQYDVVKSGGKYYVSYKSTTQSGHVPPNATYWELFHGEGPSESKVWPIREPEVNNYPGFTTRINRSEARQQIVGLDLHIDEGEATVTIRESGAGITNLTNITVKAGSPKYVDMTALKEAGEEGKVFPHELTDGAFTDMEITALGGTPVNLSATLHIEHVIWGDV